ncbi:hypothetical protein [Butyrivibrio sp. XPD2002]|uniref:hypothetical protein n=1 Tax=Butyrivibrio sp. XPD2002 TaxID=1280665 RepID=UPI00041FF93C|nr:hypothetical protein [Butyrivibrio sp. XPD2002]
MDQYFVDGIISLKDGEVFIDGGAYNGDTIDKLNKCCNKKKAKKTIKKVIAFEPGDLNERLLRKRYGNDERVKILKAGLGKKAEKVILNPQAVLHMWYMKGKIIFQ